MATAHTPPSPVASRPLIAPRHRLPLLLAFGAMLCAYGLMWGLPHLYDFAQDSVVPYGTLAQLDVSFTEVTSHRYPPLHFHVLRVAFLPARLALRFPAVAQNAKVSATLFILTARLVSVAMALGTILLLYRIGRRLWNEAVGFLAALLFILSPVTLYYARNANLDIPFTFWLAAALLAYIRLLQEDRARDYAALGILSALAVCTKDQAYGFIVLMPIPVAIHAFRASRDAQRRRFPRPVAMLLLALAAFVVPFVLIHNILFDPAGFRMHMETIMGPGSEPWRQVARGAIGQARLAVEALFRLMDAWTLAGFILVAIGVAAAFREREGRRVRLAVLVPVVSYHLAFIAVIGYVYPRFMLPTLLALAPFAAKGAQALWQWRPRAGRALAVACVAWVGLAGLALSHVMSEYARYDAQMWMQENIPPEARIVHIGPERDMPRINDPLDAQPLIEPGAPQNDALYEDALRQLRPAPDVLLLSFPQGHPAAGRLPLRLSSYARKWMGNWGISPDARTARPHGFYDRLLQGEYGYQVVARFESPIARFVPEVSESVNRTIVIMARTRP